jgi:hypothetical protein
MRRTIRAALTAPVSPVALGFILHADGQNTHCATLPDTLELKNLKWGLCEVLFSPRLRSTGSGQTGNGDRRRANEM